MIQIFALTDLGLTLAHKLEQVLPGDDIQVQYKAKPFAEKVQAAFQNGDKLIFICATGIVMRTLAPVLQNKHQDPPVLVLDEMGKFVIPLLSGHEGGANDWAHQVSCLLSVSNYHRIALFTATLYVRYGLRKRLFIGVFRRAYVRKLDSSRAFD